MLKLRGELAKKIIEIPYFNLHDFNAADLSYRTMTDCGNVQNSPDPNAVKCGEEWYCD